jgi:hypothetical protein
MNFPHISASLIIFNENVIESNATSNAELFSPRNPYYSLKRKVRETERERERERERVSDRKKGGQRNEKRGSGEENLLNEMACQIFIPDITQ